MVKVGDGSSRESYFVPAANGLTGRTTLFYLTRSMNAVNEHLVTTSIISQSCFVMFNFFFITISSLYNTQMHIRMYIGKQHTCQEVYTKTTRKNILRTYLCGL